MHIDFAKGRIRYRHQHPRLHQEMIVKAIGWKKNVPLRVFDTTAGLGQEAFLLASIGCEVVLFERNPIIAALLKEGLEKATQDPDIAFIIARMQFIEGCAITHLKELTLPPPDVIYCDPMFEARTKSAAVKKEMQFLQSIVSTDEDAATLVSVAQQVAKKRVVVKRPLRAPLLGSKPDYHLSGRSHRYDVYLKLN